MSIQLTFGKHRGALLADVALREPGYLTWMIEKADEGTAYPPVMRYVDDHRADIIEALKPQGLNASQAGAVATITADLLEGDAACYRLEGGAGYGKSFTVKAVVANAIGLGYKVRACATSYVATEVLKQQLQGLAGCRTIASTLRLAKEEEEDRESYAVSQDTGTELRGLLGYQCLLVVDEYSMVNDELAGLMIAAAENHGGRLLVVGDLKQLPPVGQHTPSVFARIKGGVELTEPMRYARDSDLYMLEQVARHEPHAVSGITFPTPDKVVRHPDLDSLLARYVHDAKHNGGDNRLVFFRRQDVMQANHYVRAQLFGQASERRPVLDGERLMVMNTRDLPSQHPDYVALAQAWGRTEATRRFYSGETFPVESWEEGEHQVEVYLKAERRTLTVCVPCYRVEFEGDPTAYPIIFASGDQYAAEGLGGEELREALRGLRDYGKRTGDWAPWRRVNNAFLQVGYGYAMTVHRCQGQTVDRVYFAFNKLAASGKMADPLIYVAATRARRQVHLA